MFEVNPEIVRNAMFERGVGIRDFSKLVGLNELTIRKLLQGEEKVSAKVIGKLANSLNIEGNQLLKKGS